VDDGSSALNAVLDQLSEEDNPPLAILLSPRHDFPLEYRRLVEGGSDATVRIELDNQLFPYFAQNRRITAVTELAGGASPPTGTFDGFSASDGTINLAQSNASSVFLVKYVLVRST
jgi:hypothetical protein